MFKLLEKYRPETKLAKKIRLRKKAEERAAAAGKAGGAEAGLPSKRPNIVRFGVNNVVKLVEQKKAQLVVIAHDVEPIEVNISKTWLCL